MKRTSQRLLAGTLAGVLLLPVVAAADKLDCKNHHASGEGPAPASLSENSSLCSMTFGSTNSSKANAFLGGLLQGAPPDARQFHFSEGGVRTYRQQFNVTANGPFDNAVLFFQALRVLDSIRKETSAADTLDALFFVMAGSATESFAEEYGKLLRTYWDNRSSIASSLQAPLELMAQKNLTDRSFGSFRLTLGGGCLIAEIENTRFVASIAQSLRTDFRNCRSPG